MARRVVSLEDGAYRRTRALKKSERAGLIPATPAPTTRWQKFVRSAVG